MQCPCVQFCNNLLTKFPAGALAIPTPALRPESQYLYRFPPGQTPGMKFLLSSRVSLATMITTSSLGPSPGHNLPRTPQCPRPPQACMYVCSPATKLTAWSAALPPGTSPEHALSSCQMSIIKHRFKEKLIKTFKMETAKH